MSLGVIDYMEPWLLGIWAVGQAPPCLGKIVAFVSTFVNVIHAFDHRLGTLLHEDKDLLQRNFVSDALVSCNSVSYHSFRRK